MLSLIYRTRCFVFQQHNISNNYFVSRKFSVKELPWCAPLNSPNRKAQAATTDKKDDDVSKDVVHQPIDRFGIVAATSTCKNRVIGKDGVIPWPRIAKDRQLFKQLTRQRIIIIGRKTLEECQILGKGKKLLHVNHTKHCIVLSNTLENLDNYDEEKGDCKLRLARSFPEALDLARKLVQTDDDYKNRNNDSIYCWVAGGEKIFEEALRHPSATEIRLSFVDMEIEVTRGSTYAQFPAKYRWDNAFKEVSHRDYPSVTPPIPSFSHKIYWRQRYNG